RTLAMLTTLCLVATRVAVVDQGVEVDVGQCIDMTTSPAITTIGAAKFLVFLVAERHAAIAAVARSNVNKSFIYEFHGRYLPPLSGQNGACQHGRPVAHALLSHWRDKAHSLKTPKPRQCGALARA